MVRHTAALLLVLSMMLLPATAVWAQETAASAVEEPTETELSEARFLELINDARDAVGVQPLVVNDELSGIARAWSLEMHEAGEMTHNPNYSDQYSGEGVLAENVAHYDWPAGDILEMTDILHELFMGSPGHRRNIERARFNQVGIGVVRIDGHMWVTVNFLDGPIPAELHDADGALADDGPADGAPADGTPADGAPTDDAEDTAVPTHHGRPGR